MYTEKKYSYIEWIDAEEVHQQSKKYFSELSFIKAEQQFLNTLLQSFATIPIDEKQLGQIISFRKALAENERRLITIFKQVQKHMNQLEIMMDDTDQLEMEKAYVKTHQNLFKRVYKFLFDYRTIKEKGFAELSLILKTRKNKTAIGNPEYKLKTISHEN